MTAAWDRAKETSTGALAWRVVFDGIQDQFVSLEEMAREPATEVDVRRISGLFTEGLRLSETADLILAKWQPSGFKLRVPHEVGLPVFHTDATAITYLDEDNVSDIQLTFGVTGAEAFGASGVIYMGTETMHFSARDDISFGGLTRGLWSVNGESAQYHYRSSAFISDDRLTVPEITDRPAVFEFRRVYLYVYAPGDDLQGDGTRVWAGLCSTEPTSDGEYWSWTVDSLRRLWSFDLAADLSDEFGLRGAYYSAGTRLRVEVNEYSLSTKPQRADLPTNQLSFELIGLLANRDEFLATLNHILSVESASWAGWSVASTGGVRAEARGSAWGLVYEAASPSPRWIELRVDSATDGVSPDDHSIGELGADGIPVTQVLSGVEYGNVYRQPDGDLGLFPPGGGGTFPRTAYAPVFFLRRTSGARRGPSGGHRYTYETSTGTFDAANLSSGWSGYALQVNRLALSAPVQLLPGRTAVRVEWEGLDPAPEASYASSGFQGVASVVGELPGVVAPDGAARVLPEDPSLQLVATGQNPPTFKVMREYVRRGNLADFIQQLLDDRAQFLNLGIAPDLRPDDFAAGWDTALREAAAASTLLNERGYIAGSALDLGEVIEHDLRLAGCYSHFSLEGRINFREVRPPSAVELLDATIDVDQLVTDGFWFQYDPAQTGIYNHVHHKTGYDPLEDEYVGPDWNHRWQRGFSRVPGGRTLTVKPKSIDPPRRPEHDGHRIAGAHRVLATFGERYAILTVQVLFERFDTIVGHVVGVTWSKLPNSAGESGASVTVRVIGRSWEPGVAYGTLTLLLSRVRYGGYAPGAKCETLVGTSGTTGPFTVTVDLPSYFPAGSDLTQFIEVDDEIEVYRWGHKVADLHVATVTAVGTDQLTFTTTEALAHTGFTWAWGARRAVEYSVAQNLADFAFEANRSSRIDFADGPVPRLVFAP